MNILQSRVPIIATGSALLACVDIVARLADDYSVKKSGKNAIRYAATKEMECTES